MKRTEQLRRRRMVSEFFSFTATLFLLVAALIALGGPAQ